MYACIHVWGRVRACVRVFVCMCVCEIEPGALLITPAWHGATHLLLQTPRVMASWHRRRAHCKASFIRTLNHPYHIGPLASWA